MAAELPQDFVRLMHEHYDRATADALCEALTTTEPEVSVRLNPRKLTSGELLACRPDLEPVPWCPDAFYLKERPAFTFDPLLHAGAYYVQEAASMYIAPLLLPPRGTDPPRPSLKGRGNVSPLRGDIEGSFPQGGSGEGAEYLPIDLTYTEALRYLRREALRIEAPRGPVTLRYRGLVLGPGKSVGSRINNLYPEAWRIRTTYTTPFSLLDMVEDTQTPNN